MADHFLDTSAAVKHSRAERGTATVDSLLADGGSRHFLSALGVVEAQQLLVRYATIRGLRTLDAIQLAVALGLHAATPLDAFVCADANLCQVAVAETLAVINPEIP